MNIVRDDNNDMTNSQSMTGVVGIIVMSIVIIWTANFLSNGSNARK
jgi:hypothetical protein